MRNPSRFATGNLSIFRSQTNNMASTIEAQFVAASTIVGDIHEHIPTLRDYAAQCDSVLELGVRSCVSTWAFLKGLLTADTTVSSEKKRFECSDIEDHPNINEARLAAQAAGIAFVFHKGNDLDLDLQDFDLTFIDTWHVYGQLRRELIKFAPRTRKFIIMHDTEVDAEAGESLRSCMHLIPHQAAQSGIPEDEIRRGLRPAIEEFLADHPEWTVRAKFCNNNGLTVLART